MQGPEGRFLATQTEMTTYTLNPALAWRPLPRLSVAAGLDLALFDATPAPASGSDVVAGGRGIGTVVSAAAGACLAVLPLEREPGPLQAEGIALHDRPLLGGLAR